MTEALGRPGANIGRLGDWDGTGGMLAVQGSHVTPTEAVPPALAAPTPGFPRISIHPSSAPPLSSRPGRAGSFGPGASLKLRTPFRAPGKRVAACVPRHLPWPCFVFIKSASVFLSPSLFIFSLALSLLSPASRPSPSISRSCSTPPAPPSPSVSASPPGPPSVPPSLPGRERRLSPCLPLFPLLPLRIRLLHPDALPGSPHPFPARSCPQRGRAWPPPPRGRGAAP